jgi:hypothetical protein
MIRHIHELAPWEGRELLDANAQSIGIIAGLGYPRRKFGTTWLLVDTSVRKVLVPADQIELLGDRLMLPYPKTYVDNSPAVDKEQPFSRAEERRLCLHYGLDSLLPNSGCRQGCGLCQAARRAKIKDIRG